MSNEGLIEELNQILANFQSQAAISKKHESDQTAELNVALAKAQCEYPIISLNRKDSFLNNAYTDLDNIMVKIRPILGSNGISVTQRTKLNDDKTFIETRIWHSSGQWIESMERFRPSVDNIDVYNSEINEIRKAQIMSLLNITIKNDEFDDNGYESLKYEHDRKISTKAPEEKKASFVPLAKSDVDQIEKELEFLDQKYRAKLLKDLHVRAVADINKNQLDAVLKSIRKNKESLKISRRY